MGWGTQTPLTPKPISAHANLGRGRTQPPARSYSQFARPHSSARAQPKAARLWLPVGADAEAAPQRPQSQRLGPGASSTVRSSVVLSRRALASSRSGSRTVTCSTHPRVSARDRDVAESLRLVRGWTSGRRSPSRAEKPVARQPSPWIAERRRRRRRPPAARSAPPQTRSSRSRERRQAQPPTHRRGGRGSSER